MKSIDDVLEFWFGPDSDDTSRLARASMWFAKDPTLDAAIRDHFGDTHDALRAGRAEEWMSSPEGMLAAVLVLDQFSRNMFRDTPEAFATDRRALEISLRAQRSGVDASLSPVQNWFLYMPMMHSESLEIQGRSLLRYEALATSAPPESATALSGAYAYARRHAEIIERFGRYPHRNAILGRTSTPEELEFLEQPHSSF